MKDVSLARARDALAGKLPVDQGESLVFGVEVGRPAPTYDRGLAAFAVRELDGRFAVRAVGATDLVETHKLWPFYRLFEKLPSAHPVLFAIDAPMTPGEPRPAPHTGRAVEKRLSRGAFSTSKRGLQPVSLAVHLQGAYLGQEAESVRRRLQELGVRYAQFPEDQDSYRMHCPAIIEVLPRLTAGLLSPRRLVAEVRPRGPKTSLLETFLFPYLFSSDPEEFQRPSFADRRLASDWFSDTLEFDPSLLLDAQRCRDHQRVGAFLSAFQGVLALTGLASLMGQPGASEGCICVPRQWHRDWEAIWSETSRPGDSVRRIDLLSDLAGALQ